MKYTTADPFLVYWHNAMIIGGILMIISGVSYYLLHKLRVFLIRDYKEKYDFINSREIKSYKIVFLCFGVATMMAINLYGMNSIFKLEIWFFVRLFMSIAGGTLVSYVAILILEYYYPTILHKKLSKWRYMPRINPQNGNKMRLLSEEEEDVHLIPGMVAEENIFSIDYDVWVDESTGDVKIEKYPGKLQALKCNNCTFYTMRIVKEEITKEPTVDSPGELIKHYQCSYCKSIRATAFNISTKEAEDYKESALKYGFRANKSIEMIRVEIHSSLRGKRYFEFQNISEAVRFLNDYEDK